jgi:uncharacterized protein YegJ (DUF2314 family)
MAYAISFARASIEVPIRELEQGAISAFDVKAPIPCKEKCEHVWLRGLHLANGFFTGIIDNDVIGGTLPRCGEIYSIQKNKISDWHYMLNGRMNGAFTLRVLLDKMPPRQAAKLRDLLLPFEGFQ